MWGRGRHRGQVLEGERGKVNGERLLWCCLWDDIVGSTFHKILKLFNTKHTSEAMLVFPQVFPPYWGLMRRFGRVFFYIYDVFKWLLLIPTGFSSKYMWYNFIPSVTHQRYFYFLASGWWIPTIYYPWSKVLQPLLCLITTSFMLHGVPDLYKRHRDLPTPNFYIPHRGYHSFWNFSMYPQIKC